MLRVNGDGFTAGQVGEVDALTGAAKAQFDSVMHQALALQPRAYAGLDHQIGGALLEHAGAHALRDIFLRAAFEHDGVDALRMKKVREHQPSGSCSDDSDLSSHIIYTQTKPHTPGSSDTPLLESLTMLL